MPEVGAFLHGFGLVKNLQIDGFVLEKRKASHKSIVRYRKYEYPIHLTFVGSGNVKNLLIKLKSYLSGSKVIKSRYHNPYRCHIASVDLENVTEKGDTTIVEIFAMGKSERI